MPLLLICGRPASGKTHRANELAKYLKEKHNKEAIIINEEYLKLIKNDAYKDPINEKMTRGFLKSNVEKHIHSGQVLIFDSLNYIKGYRYEVYCLARAAKSTYCLLYCNSPVEVCTNYNKNMENNYNDQLFDDLFKRMEVPKQKDRWDSPYYEVRYNEATPMDDIIDTLLFQDKKSKDPTATKQEQQHEGNYVQEQDKRIQDIIDQIQNAQLYALENTNGVVKINDSKLTIKLERQLSLIEFKRLRLEFLNMVRVNPINNINLIQDSFINFIQAQISRI